MSSASRSALAILAIAVSAALTRADLSAVALAKADDLTSEYDGRFSFVRISYGMANDLARGRFRREPPWHHDFPRADFHFLKILDEITNVETLVDGPNIRALDDPELTKFPIIYMSEPGYWTMNEAEAAGLRAYLQKGGFIIFDDFRTVHNENLFAQMKQVLPDARWQPLAVDHPIFHSFFEIKSLDVDSYYGRAEWLGSYEDNDASKRLLAVANSNHDLGEYWEFSDTGYMPVDLSNEAYKFGVNYVMYGLTH